MARPHGYMPVARYFVSLLLILGTLYALLFFGGSDHTPKLGLDLRGGTTVTLRALTEDGDAPSQSDLQVARQIIENRVNGLGVSSAEVTTEGDRNIIISVPGEGGEQVKQLGATALLEMRPVIGVASPQAPPEAESPIAATGQDAPATNQGAVADPNAPVTNGRPLPAVAQSTTDPAAPAPAPEPTVGSTEPDPAATDPAATDPAAPEPQSIPQGAASPEEAQAIAAQLDCSALNLTAELPKAEEYMVACDSAGQKLILGPVLIKGTQVTDAAAGFDTQTGKGWVVSVDFDSAGTNTWADYTGANIGKQVAFVLDQRVLTAPVINARISGTTQIEGGFTQEGATNLANSLKFGALPLTFTQSEARTISATLGNEQLQAGLIAGAIGLGLVVVYCLIYYRLLGLITIASLALSAVLVYAVLVLLSREVGLTLTLSGIAGFIVAIGITADSFVVFFERLKDEVREGRSMRSAVPRAWARSKRTILSADAVSFLAAVILYFMTIGEVRGFAFTLGLSTVLDLVIVFLFTHPIMSWLSRFNAFSSPLISGLGRSVPSGRSAGPDRRESSTAKERAAARRAALKES